MIANGNALIEFFSLEVLREKVKNILENSGNLVSQTRDHPVRAKELPQPQLRPDYCENYIWRVIH